MDENEYPNDRVLEMADGHLNGAASNGSARLRLSDFLKTWRITNGLPLKAVAEDVGVSIETISAWEHGHRFPSADNLDNLATYIGIPVCRFFCQYRNRDNSAFDGCQCGSTLSGKKRFSFEGLL